MKSRASAAPHQGLLTRVFGPSASALATQASLTISFRTRRNYLETFLPGSNSSIRAMGGWATALLALTRRDEKHASLALSIPNALLSPASNESKETETVTPIIFDNDIDRVAFGSEVDLPLCYAEIKEYTLGDRRLLTVGRGEDVFIGISLALAAGDCAQVFFSRLSDAELEIRYPALVHIIGRIQGLEVVGVTDVVGTLATVL